MDEAVIKDGDLTQFVIDEDFKKSRIILFKEDIEPSCSNFFADRCINHFALKTGFDDYYDCSEASTFEDFYLPRHFKIGNQESGTPIDFDSLLLSVKDLVRVDFNISPNPTDGTFTISSQDLGDVQFCLISVDGKKHWLNEVNNQNTNRIYQIDLPPGIYFVQGLLQDGRVTKAGKLVIR